MALSKEEIFEAIKELPVLELAGLVKDLEEEFGVSAAPPVEMSTVQGVEVTSDAAGEEEEKSYFSGLKSFPDLGMIFRSILVRFGSHFGSILVIKTRSKNETKNRGPKRASEWGGVPRLGTPSKRDQGGSPRWFLSPQCIKHWGQKHPQQTIIRGCPRWFFGHHQRSQLRIRLEDEG